MLINQSVIQSGQSFNFNDDLFYLCYALILVLSRYDFKKCPSPRPGYKENSDRSLTLDISFLVIQNVEE